MAWSVGLSWQVLVGLSWALWGRWRQQPRLVRPLMLFLAGCGVAVELAVYSIWEAGPTAEESLWIGCYFLASLVGKRPELCYECRHHPDHRPAAQRRR